MPAYDAGTEVNDEKCENIPGPPCDDKGANGVEEGGVVHIHNGIHGIGGDGVEPAEHDWRNPVAKITVTRVNDRGSNGDDDDDD